MQSSVYFNLILRRSHRDLSVYPLVKEEPGVSKLLYIIPGMNKRNLFWRIFMNKQIGSLILIACFLCIGVQGVYAIGDEQTVDEWHNVNWE